ncbi:molybdate ABC transporter substrate-binding protein [Rhizobium sp. KVB221]|uniref:Molybdate ABC transporter substrate-binding protein n=1 Tax=Rhizobium setariae TaxID=2801340 RepID=A0A936YIF4_9HYPH|nr:molybdate ABC transporter substrate-binding protein [Rhizobium setariae]MBL0370780.1 molybdate ABC transporter substrate-binding protein [Rhizobium setariae]
MFRRSFLVSVAAAVAVSAISLLPARAEDKVLNVFAAASMKGSLDKVAALYEKKAGVKVSISFAASSALAKQIEAAAPADVFISADMKWMNYLVEKGAVKKEEVVKLLGNRLVLVAAKDSTISLKIEKEFPLAKALGEDGHLAMGEVKSVPAGKYGKESLEFYGVWKDVESRVAGADNVRAALQLVTRGEAPLGIVYETDAKAEQGVKVVDTFGEDSHTPIVYPVAPVAASTKAEAKDFLSFLNGAEAQAVFKQAGFTVLTGS